MTLRLTFIFALLLLAQAAVADVTVTYMNCAPGGQHHIAMSEGNPVANDVLMGVYNWDDYYSDAIYQTFCIDAETLAGNDAVTYACVPLTEARATPGLTSGQLSAYRAYLLDALWGQHHAQTATNEGAIAFGLAVYEIVYDGEQMDYSSGLLAPAYDFEGGIFDGSNAGASAIWPMTKSMLNSLDYYGMSTSLIAWAADGGQDQITEDDTPTATSESSWGELKSLY